MATRVLPIRPAEPEDRVTVPALRQRHVDLLKSWLELSGEVRAARGEAFRREVQAAGACLEDWSDRDAAQSLIDYWTATLANQDGVEAYPELIELAPFDEATRRSIKHLPSPFLGLNAFRELDGNRFFGRRAATAALAERVEAQPVTIVSGPSGSGKSSLVFAGLLPALRHAGGWEVSRAVVPGADPVAALLGAVRPRDVPDDWLDSERVALGADSGRFADLLETAVGPGRRVVLVVDQAEELFTPEVEGEVRRQFVDALAALMARPTGHRLVVTVRGDYLETLVEGMARLGAGADVVFQPPPLTSRELHDAITGPAERIGLKIDDDVVEDLVREVIGEPAALPLLQFALSRLWLQADVDRITRVQYEKVGKPSDALGRAAEQIFFDLKIDEKRAAAELIFLALTKPQVGGETLRRRASRETLRKLAAADRIDDVLDAFVRGGLLHRLPGEERDDDRFEITHETLIRHWPRLRDWLARRHRRDEARERLIAAAEQWRKTGRRNGYLLTGRALDEAQEYQGASPELDQYLAEGRRWTRLLFWMRFAAFAIGIAAIAIAVLLASNRQRRLDEAINDVASLSTKSIVAARAVRTSRAGGAAASRAQIAEQTLARLLAQGRLQPDDLPAPLLRRLDGQVPATAAAMLRLNGYDPNFLDVHLPLPAPRQRQVRLAYNNFSVIYDLDTRTPIVAAGNLDRLAARLPFVTASILPLDPRISPALQPEGLTGTDRNIGRVPLLSWTDVGWAQREIADAIARTDFRPATVLQSWNDNQGAWSDIGRAILGIDADRLSVAGGVVLRRGIGLGSDKGPPMPSAYWKMAAYRDGAGALQMRAYLMPANASTGAGQGVARYQVSLDQLQKETGLRFAALARPRPVPAGAISASAQATVYLQFAVMPRSVAREIAAALIAHGYATPGEERVSVAVGMHQVRYYHDEDRDAAFKLAKETERILSQLGFRDVNVAISRPQLGAGARRPAARVLELWLGSAPAPNRKSAG